MPRRKELFREIGAWMRERRLENGLTIREAAYLLSWDPATLKSYEEGAEIELETLKKFAARFLLDREAMIGSILEIYLDSVIEDE
jgi:transcriptional regulator with XRE-family HTH domain